MWSSPPRPCHLQQLPQGAVARLNARRGKGGEKTGGRRHWVGDFTFIPFSNTASLTLSLTLGPGWTDRRGGAAIDLPVIMGVTQEATWPPSSSLAALQTCIKAEDHARTAATVGKVMF